MCVQSIANLACDNEPDKHGESSVTRIGACGARGRGRAHGAPPTNPRLLEDAICALSNMAFVSDKIQLQIGRSLHGRRVRGRDQLQPRDSYLFQVRRRGLRLPASLVLPALTRALPPAAAAAQMTLRAIGNLTRCDENIMRAVGYGVIRGMVDGMTEHADDPTVLQLCADVIGNMASVTTEGAQGGGRAHHDEVRAEAPASMLVPRPPPAPRKTMLPARRPPLCWGRRAARPRPPQALRAQAAAARGLRRHGLDVLSAARGTSRRPCARSSTMTAAGALLAAMTKHIRNPDLAGSCLRALHYIGASPALVGRMVTDLKVRRAQRGGP